MPLRTRHLAPRPRSTAPLRSPSRAASPIAMHGCLLDNADELARLVAIAVAPHREDHRASAAGLRVDLLHGGGDVDRVADANGGVHLEARAAVHREVTDLHVRVWAARNAQRIEDARRHGQRAMRTGLGV